MSRVKSIDIEAGVHDDIYPLVDSMDFELYEDDSNGYTKDDSYGWNGYDLVLTFRIEEQMSKTGRRMMLRKKKREANRWLSRLPNLEDRSPIVSGILKYPRSKPSYKKYIPYIDHKDKWSIFDKNYHTGGFIQHYCGDMWLGCGDMPNTPETRFKLIYNRMIEPCNKLPDVLLKIIIEYLLSGEEWKRSFYWRIQLVNGYE